MSVQLFGTGDEYPEVDQNDPTYSDLAKAPPKEGEYWRFTDVKYDEPHDVETHTYTQTATNTIYPHEMMGAVCPEHGETFLVSIYAPKRFDDDPHGCVTMGVRYACGCTWRAGGLIGGGNRKAGWFRAEDEVVREHTEAERRRWKKEYDEEQRRREKREPEPEPEEQPEPAPRPVLKPAVRPAVKPVPKPGAKPVPKPAAKPVPKPTSRPTLYEG